MKKKMSLKQKLLTGFISVSILAAIIGSLGFFGISQLSGRITLLGNESIPALLDLATMKVNILKLEMSLKNLMNPYLDKAEIRAELDNIQQVRALYQAASSNYNALEMTEEESRLWKETQAAIAASAEMNNQFIKTAQTILGAGANQAEITKEMDRQFMAGGVEVKYSKALEALDGSLAYVKSYYCKKLVDESTQTGIAMTILILVAALIAIALSLALGIVLSNSITKSIHKINQDLLSSSNNVEGAAAQVAQSSQELSSGASELAASVEETTSSIEELQSIIEATTKNVNEAEMMMRKTVEGAATVTAKTEGMQKALKEISDHSSKIGKIIKVIDDIAFQTNILALNAAVEAARAGESGRGFAVVADQVKSLAQKSADAAKETAELIDTAIESVGNGEKMGASVMESQKEAGELAGKASAILEEVNRAAREELKGANQITKAVSQINSVVQETAASSEEMASSGEELLSQSEAMKNLVGNLQEIVEGLNTIQNEQKKVIAAKLVGHAKETKPAPAQGLKLAEHDHMVEIIKPEDKIPLEDRKDFENF